VGHRAKAIEVKTELLAIRSAPRRHDLDADISEDVVPRIRPQRAEGSEPIDDSSLLEDEESSLCSSQAGKAELEDVASGEDPVIEKVEAELKVPSGRRGGGMEH
jgi:hypothetical protein